MAGALTGSFAGSACDGQENAFRNGAAQGAAVGATDSLIFVGFLHFDVALGYGAAIASWTMTKLGIALPVSAT